jgi:hypothetical protein
MGTVLYKTKVVVYSPLLISTCYGCLYFLSYLRLEIFRFHISFGCIFVCVFVSMNVIYLFSVFTVFVFASDNNTGGMALQASPVKVIWLQTDLPNRCYRDVK